jgi:hypothetical protein
MPRIHVGVTVRLFEVEVGEDRQPLSDIVSLDLDHIHLLP